ncbi:MAG: hypothetical protein FWC56_02065, partial [Phycisphaerae bacterium]|nr:hypothetical protein [Phycisphaerae bacterium]
SRRIVIRTDENLGPDQYSFECFDQRGGLIRMEDMPDASRNSSDGKSKRRSGESNPSNEPKRTNKHGRETLEDVFD